MNLNQSISVSVNSSDTPAAQYKTVILKPNIVSDVNTLTQSMMAQTNTKYVIKYDFTLGEKITVPANCVLEFDGGSISGDGTYILNLNSTTEVAGKGLKCNISNPKIGNVRLSNYLSDISDSTLNKQVFQTLINAGCNIYIDIYSTIVFNNYLSASNLHIVGGERRPTLSFPDSAGFVYDNESYSVGDIVDNINITSKGHCFDFSTKPGNSAHNMNFKNIEAYSEEGSCFYCGSNTNYTVYEVTFNNIYVRADNGAGFWGFNSVGMSYIDIHGYYCKEATFVDCNGEFLNYNGCYYIGGQSVSFMKSSNSQFNPNLKSVFINCNFESYIGSIFDVDNSSGSRYTFINCKFDQNGITITSSPLRMMGSITRIILRNCYIANNNPNDIAIIEVSNITSTNIDVDFPCKVKSGSVSYTLGIESIGTNIIARRSSLFRDRNTSIVSKYDFVTPLVQTSLVLPSWKEAEYDVNNHILQLRDTNFLKLEDTNIGTVFQVDSYLDAGIQLPMLIYNNTGNTVTFANNYGTNKIITNTGQNVTLENGGVLRAMLLTTTTYKRLYLWSPFTDSNFAQNLC